MQITISNLTKRFGSKTALDHIDLEIKQGMFGLLGRNGAGKTTLMRILSTLLTKTEGTIMLGETSIDQVKDVRRMVGYLPQEFSMYANMTVYESMNYLGILSEIPKRDRQKVIKRLLTKVNLSDKSKVRVKALSGGMKRRLGIAQAIMHDPKILIVDEPTAGLDPEERIRFRNLLCEIASDRIVILSTHIVGDIEATCEHVAILNEGKIIYKGTTEALTQMAVGKVYTVTVNKAQIENTKAAYMVTGMLTQGGQASLRILSNQKPTADAVLVEPTIEDGYMLMMEGNGL